MWTEVKGRIRRMDDRTAGRLFAAALFLCSMAVFLLPGAGGYVLFDDSWSYTSFDGYVEGVMPVYPLFLQIYRLLFGEELYLYAAAAGQAALSAVCVQVLVTLLHRRFHLKYWESFCIYLMALMPFTTDLPECMTPKRIATEGIAYGLYYLFMAVLLEAVWTRRFRWEALLFGVTLLLASTRSQLQLLFGVSGIAFFYIAVMRCRGKLGKRVLGAAAGLAGCMLICVAGVWVTARGVASYKAMRENMQMRQEAAEKAAAAGMTEEEAETIEIDTAVAGAAMSGQYTTLLFSKGMYEADYEDYKLFADEVQRERFLAYYETVDGDHARYAYAEPGLWMWQDIEGGVGKIGLLTNVITLYMGDGRLQIGLALIKEHFGRFLYHTLLLMVQPFIFTIFFKIEEIYVLCHLYTLLVYVSAFALTIWAYKDRKADRAYAEFMTAVLVVNICMVAIISVVFIGLQRYVVYNFGIFYIAYFLLLRQLWKEYGKKLWDKWAAQRGTSV